MKTQTRTAFPALALLLAAGTSGVAYGAQDPAASASPSSPPAATAPSGSMGMQGSDGGMMAPPSAQTSNPILNFKAGEIAGREVYNTQGKELGKVDMIGRDRTTGDLSAVVSVGGFLGFGGSKVAIPIEQLSLRDDKLILSTAMSKKELRQQASGYQSKRYEEVAEDTTLSQVAPIAGGTAGAGQGTTPSMPDQTGSSTSFQQLDANRDGYISRNEAASDPTVMSHWRDLDRNNDGRIDSSEFSAFEQKADELRPSGDNMRERNGAMPAR